MRQQQQGSQGALPDAREQDIRMGQMTVGGTMGINIRGAMPQLLCQLLPQLLQDRHYDARWNLGSDPHQQLSALAKLLQWMELGIG